MCLALRPRHNPFSPAPGQTYMYCFESMKTEAVRAGKQCSVWLPTKSASRQSFCALPSCVCGGYPCVLERRESCERRRKEEEAVLRGGANRSSYPSDFLILPPDGGSLSIIIPLYPATPHLFPISGSSSKRIIVALPTVVAVPNPMPSLQNRSPASVHIIYFSFLDLSAMQNLPRQLPVHACM